MRPIPLPVPGARGKCASLPLLTSLTSSKESLNTWVYGRTPMLHLREVLQKKNLPSTPPTASYFKSLLTEPVAMVMAYFPREQCQVIDTWNVMGMRGTGSHDISVTDVFVPKTRTFPMVPEFEPGSHYQGPLYRFPLVGISATSLPPVMLRWHGKRSIMCPNWLRAKRQSHRAPYCENAHRLKPNWHKRRAFYARVACCSTTPLVSRGKQRWQERHTRSTKEQTCCLP
jgi:hypothetical protein